MKRHHRNTKEDRRTHRLLKDQTATRYWVLVGAVEAYDTGSYIGPFESRREAGGFRYGRIRTGTDRRAYCFWSAHGMTPRNTRVRSMKVPDVLAIEEAQYADQQLLSYAR